jgi:hypothetical protein
MVSPQTDRKFKGPDSIFSRLWALAPLFETAVIDRLASPRGYGGPVRVSMTVKWRGEQVKPPYRRPALSHAATAPCVALPPHIPVGRLREELRPTPRPPTPSPAPCVARVCPHDPRPPHPPLPRMPAAATSPIAPTALRAELVPRNPRRPGRPPSHLHQRHRTRAALAHLGNCSLRCSTSPHPCGSPAFRGISTSCTSERNIGLDNVEKLAGCP